MRLYLLIHYDGTPFSGSQAQFGNPCPTVQGELWKALDALNLRSHVKRLHFASRTDQGVHAQGQVAELDVSNDFLDRVPDLSLALNAKLPPEIAVTEVLEAGLPDEQGYYPSVQFDAVAKWYRYKWLLAPTRRPHQASNATLIHQPLNLAVMQDAAQTFVGEHDFSYFKSPGSSVTDDRCLLHYASFSQQFEEAIVFDLVGNRFLYKMIRNMVAYLHGLGDNRSQASTSLLSAQDVLVQCDRPASLRTASSQGLTLMAIHYEAPCLQFNDVRVKTLSHALKKEFSNVENLFCQNR
jgi:tRNA pseudouridine38-40 synthase